jgi:hypothetical protein
VHFENHTEKINTVFGQNSKLFVVKLRIIVTAGFITRGISLPPDL